MQGGGCPTCRNDHHHHYHHSRRHHHHHRHQHRHRPIRLHGQPIPSSGRARLTCVAQASLRMQDDLRREEVEKMMDDLAELRGKPQVRPAMTVLLASTLSARSFGDGNQEVQSSPPEVKERERVAHSTAFEYDKCVPTSTSGHLALVSLSTSVRARASCATWRASADPGS